MEKIKTFFIESWEELSERVTWPGYQELQSSAILVLVASLLFALMVGLVDIAFEKSMTWIYQSF